VAESAIKHRLPTMSNLKDVAEARGLMSYSPNWDFVSSGVRVANLVRARGP
jgi:hypothetical protein